MSPVANVPVSAHPEWASDFTDPNLLRRNLHIAARTLTDYSKVRQLGTGKPARSKPWTRLDSIVGNYDLIERISAGYLMNTIDLSLALRLVTGLRFETTHVNTLSYGTDPTT